ncbi:MAG: sulfite exporter TauE/SafE family protein [Candidatus Sericytochromatia bacterium]|nr:sulfite exporter TauE/SafE family protein [Candidatus Sericytochromatia bacterium]
MLIIGYLISILIGFTLGIFGGGGSILTVPVLVYLFHVPPVLATAYSLFIVGISTLIATISQIKNKIINFKAAINFAIPSLIGTFLSRRIIIPFIPEKIIQINNYILKKDTAILIFFSIIMLLASYSMIKPRKENNKNIDDGKYLNMYSITAISFLIGITTGIVGAGGGFLIIPTLVFLMKLEIKQAIATSILIIAVNSLIGFTGSLMAGTVLDLNFLITFTSLTVIGILLGIYFSKNIPSQKLKPAFGWFLLLMGIFILIKETIFIR